LRRVSRISAHGASFNVLARYDVNDQLELLAAKATWARQFQRSAHARPPNGNEAAQPTGAFDLMVDYHITDDASVQLRID